MKFYKSFFLSINWGLICFILVPVISCQNNGNNNGLSDSQSVFPVDINVDSANIGTGTEHFASETMEVKTFEIKDSTGNLQGWGYDIYSKGKKTIHQPIIPAIPGNWPFKSESDALKTGLFALSKMEKEGTLPTLSIFELDSLGVTK